MLQYPTNVSPENTAKPADATKMSFTFNGDRLSYYRIRATDLETNTKIGIEYKSEDMESNNGLPLYNGEQLTMANNASGLTNGHNYVWQVLLAQRDLAGENPLYDIPVCRGAIIGVDPNDTTKIYIDSKLPLYEWGYSSGAYYPTLDDDDNVLVGMVLEVEGERKLITSYVANAYINQKYVGIATVESAFTTTPTANKRYQIYSNYLISPQYYYMCRSTPSVSLSLELVHVGLDFDLQATGTYSQAESSPIKYYNLVLYACKDVSETSELYKIKESEKIFSQRIKYSFKNCLLGINPWTKEDVTTVNYRVVCELVTQDNVTYATYDTITVEGIDDYAPTSQDRTYTWLPINLYGCNYCRETFGRTSNTPLFYRTDLDTGETIKLSDIEAQCDFKVSTKGNYQYTSIVYNSDEAKPYLKSIRHYNVKTDFDGYFITALIPQSDTLYYVGDTWKFICDIDNSTILQNLDVVSQVGYSPYPSVSSTELNYMSGTLSGYIGYFDCCDHEYKDEIAVVKAWREFISQPHPFLLKSQKGDVWMVNIIESPKVEYQEDYYKIPTRFTFSWAECGDVNDYIIGRANGDTLDYAKISCSSKAPSDKDWYDITTADDYIYYKRYNKISIVRYIGSSSQPIVPDTIEGCPVTTICATAFYDGNVMAVWLPDTITTIE